MALMKHTLYPSSSIELELLYLLARQGWMAPIPALMTLAVIAGFAADQGIATLYWGGWLALCALVLAIRSVILIKLPTLNRFSEKGRLNTAIALSAFNACTHALSLFFFPDFTEHQRTVQTMILLGIGTITVITTAGFLPISLAYILPTAVPIALLWGVTTATEGNAWIGYAVAVMACSSSIIMMRLSTDTFELFKESFEIRLRQSQLNNRLKGALKEAENASRAKTRFLASASHDLRQPIHALSLFGGALARRPLDAQSREIAKHMDLALQSLTSRLDSLLDISKLDAGIVQANKTPFNLRLLVERLQDEFMPAAESKNLKIWLDCADDADVDTDELLLERIIRNLLSNAIKYTDTGRIDISVEDKNSLFQLKISDSGRGIPLEEHERVFEEFYQLNNPERDHTKGLGLGLAIVKRLSDLLGIHIEMESLIGTGTRFSLSLNKSERQPVIAAQTKKIELSWQNLCALVIDDEREVALGMKILLEGAGCKVLLADSTLTALTQARQERPDIILADFRLRGEDNGIISIRAIRELYQELPAILISGDTAPQRLREAEDAGIQLLHKPILVDDLELAIANACDLNDCGLNDCDSDNPHLNSGESNHTAQNSDTYTLKSA